MILLDTNIVIWLSSEVERLSENAKVAMEEARKSGAALAISSVTLLELATLSSKGRLHFEISFEEFLTDIEERFVVLPITARACAQIPSLPASYPSDPADRMIGATAIAEGISLVTA